MSRPTIVLVHGAWHGAWCWELVKDRLEAAGVDVVAVDLPGHGASREPMTDLHGDAAAVTSALDTVDGPVVLVGHSYGGAVVTEAGAHDRVAHVVYIAAFNLADGECVARAAADDAAVADIDHSGRPELGAILTRVDGRKSTTVIAELAAPIFYNDCTVETRHRGQSRSSARNSWPTSPTSQRPSPGANRPSTYVICGDDNAVHPDLQRILARRATTSIEWPTGHSPFLSQPQLVSDFLQKVMTSIT